MCVCSLLHMRTSHLPLHFALHPSPFSFPFLLLTPIWPFSHPCSPGDWCRIHVGQVQALRTMSACHHFSHFRGVSDSWSRLPSSLPGSGRRCILSSTRSTCCPLCLYVGQRRDGRLHRADAAVLLPSCKRGKVDSEGSLFVAREYSCTA
ncbi:hypothetical protein FA13DRAFT_814880 [Coprinellus micaceus]|uniref:Uncharacterized protein n=1 Tax=Coprinellus micaceus TaxID=71717 RepID=A0A4Y7T1U3_COPMI|nr:hypothetical protein FA13DRAFT_814880 [Coprinellus micaceus]